MSPQTCLSCFTPDHLRPPQRNLPFPPSYWTTPLARSLSSLEGLYVPFQPFSSPLCSPQPLVADRPRPSTDLRTATSAERGNEGVAGGCSRDSRRAHAGCTGRPPAPEDGQIPREAVPTLVRSAGRCCSEFEETLYLPQKPSYVPAVTQMRHKKYRKPREISKRFISKTSALCRCCLLLLSLHSISPAPPQTSHTRLTMSTSSYSTVLVTGSFFPFPPSFGPSRRSPFSHTLSTTTLTSPAV
jgi:hypothetical protein